jgi:hypothetical protein
MTEEEVIELMKTSISLQEWNDNCKLVKKNCNGHYPDFWYSIMILSGLADQIVNKFGMDTKIRIVTRE